VSDQDEYVEWDMCPMGCGNPTDDVAGGPCSDCWDAVDDGLVSGPFGMPRPVDPPAEEGSR
jgi:hypothetical protein